MNENRIGWFGFAVSLGLFGVGVVGFLIALVSPEASAWLYFKALSLTFLIVAGAGGFAFHVPVVYAEWTASARHASEMRYEAARFDDRSRRIGDPVPESNLQSPSRSVLSEAWRNYWLDYLRYAQECGGISFTRTADFFPGQRQAALETWQAALSPLIREGIVEPITTGVPTGFSPGWTLNQLITFFDNGHCIQDKYIPPTPPPARTDPKRRNAGNAQKRGETAGNAEMEIETA